MWSGTTQSFSRVPSCKHQGDVTFARIAKLPKGAAPIEHKGSFVLALGEKTGHKHVITVEREEGMKLFREENGTVYAVLATPATITHEEHGLIRLESSIWRIGREREKDWFSMAVRQVID